MSGLPSLIDPEPHEPGSVGLCQLMQRGIGVDRVEPTFGGTIEHGAGMVRRLPLGLPSTVEHDNDDPRTVLLLQAYEPIHQQAGNAHCRLVIVHALIAYAIACPH